MKIITTEQVDAIIKGYEVDLVSMIDLANRYGVTRQAIHKLLRRYGIDTSKKRIEVTCCACGVSIMRPKCQLRNRKRVFCSDDCYHAFLGSIGDSYKPWRHGQRIARMKVAKFFNLQEGNIVHHLDGNNFNNELHNLVVFANQGDHIRFHRGFEAHPIWP